MLHATIRGDGPPVLLLHSSGFSSRQWSSLADLLSVRYRVIVPDLLGYGANPLITDDVPYDYNDEVAALLDLLGDIQPHIVGHSFGGMVALMLARKEPERVRSLALYDPVAFGVLYDAHDDEALPSFDALNATPLFRADPTGGSEEWLRLFIDYWNGGPSWDALQPSAKEGFLRVGRKMFREVMQVTLDGTRRAAYANIDAPTLLMTGEHSPAAAQHTVRHLAQSLQNATMQTFAGAGHMGPITHAKEVNEAIAAHLAQPRINRQM
jgi:pimeloyl-ACP methyl ester carboxylesterase